MRTTRQQRYDTGQHQLVCTDLGVSNNPDAPGPTAHEAVQNLKQQHQETVRLLERAALLIDENAYEGCAKDIRAHLAKLKEGAK